VNWVTLVEALRLAPMPTNVTEWSAKQVQRWMATYLHMGADPRVLDAFRKCKGEELLMLPLRERLHCVERAAFQAGKEEEEQKQKEENRENDRGGNASSSSGSSSNAAANRRRRAKHASTVKVAGSYLEHKYGLTNALHRRKILMECKCLLQRRRTQRRTLKGTFQVEEWRTVDVIDWLQYDVRLPEYTMNFMEAGLDGMTLRDGLSNVILKQDMDILQKRHRNKILNCIKTLKIGQPLVSPTRKGRRSSGGGRDEGAGGIALTQMDGAENLLSGGDSDGFSGGEEEGKQYLLDFDSPKHNARLLENIRNQVEAELKGISHGGELVDMVSGGWR
jgi:hypothetical protein